METYEEIKEFLDSRIGVEGGLTLERAALNQSNQSVYERADSYAESLGFRRLGKRWQKLDKENAVLLLSRMLHKSLAYKIELLPMKTARYVSEKFISQFDSWSSVCLSNGYIMEDTASWDSITESTFEMAFVIMDEVFISLVCVEDED